MTYRGWPSVEVLEARRLFSYLPIGLTPFQVRHAYGFDRAAIWYQGGWVAGDGSGQTIAIVEAYADPNIFTDLKSFDHQYHLPDYDWAGQYVLSRARPLGHVSADPNWAMEEALDVEWAHAIAPRAHILLVEAPTDGMSDLLYAVDYARHQSGVAAISMSWGGGEFPGESAYDRTFTTPAGHGGIAFFTASGDNGAPAGWPAVSPNVISVGGTTLHVDQWGDYLGEAAWNGSGGGVSQFESVTTRSPVVAYNADPASGYTIYCSWGQWRGPWLNVGGTSAGPPQWAALFAIADQGRALAGKGSFNTAAALGALSTLASSDFHDITSGSNGWYSARTGYDLVTGRGSPLADRIIRDLQRY